MSIWFRCEYEVIWVCLICVLLWVWLCGYVGACVHVGVGVAMRVELGVNKEGLDNWL